MSLHQNNRLVLKHMNQKLSLMMKILVKLWRTLIDDFQRIKMEKGHQTKFLINTTPTMMLLMKDSKIKDSLKKLLWRKTQEMSLHLLTISEDYKTLQLQWKANSQRKEIILHPLIISLKRKRNDLTINHEQRILIKMILRKLRLITTEAILTITELNLIHNSQEIQQVHLSLIHIWRCRRRG